MDPAVLMGSPLGPSACPGPGLSGWAPVPRVWRTGSSQQETMGSGRVARLELSGHPRLYPALAGFMSQSHSVPIFGITGKNICFKLSKW